MYDNEFTSDSSLDIETDDLSSSSSDISIDVSEDVDVDTVITDVNSAEVDVLDENTNEDIATEETVLLSDGVGGLDDVSDEFGEKIVGDFQASIDIDSAADLIEMDQHVLSHDLSEPAVESEEAIPVLDVEDSLSEDTDGELEGQEASETDDGLTDEERAQIIRDVVDQNVTASALPRNGGHWLDESTPGDTTWVLDDDAEITWQKGGNKHTISGSELKEKYGIDGIAYSGKEPDFSPFEDGTIGHVELEDFSDQRTGKTGTYASATRAAAETLGWDMKQVEQYMEDNGLTWHECGDRKTVRAIPTEINAAFKHTGGIGIERSVKAMSDELVDRYGGFSLRRDSPIGTVSMDEMNDAVEQVRQGYKERKRSQ